MVTSLPMISLLLLLGLKKMSLKSGWYSLAEAQFKTHKYTDSALSCSQGIFYVYISMKTSLQ